MSNSLAGSPVLHYLPELAQTHVHDSVMLSNHLILHHRLLSPSILPSIRVFSNELALHIRWPKYWSFSFSNEYSEYWGLISFRMDWLDLLAVQETLKSLLQHHSSKESVLQCSAFFMVLCSHPYMTTGKTIALTRETTRLFWNTAAPVSSPINSPRALALFHMLANTWHCEFFFPFSFLSSWWTCSNISV